MYLIPLIVNHLLLTRGGLYILFDVDASRVSPGGRSDWGIVSGPGSFLDRLNQARGGEPITDMPRAYNIVLVREG